MRDQAGGGQPPPADRVSGLQFPLLDPQVAREIRIVPANRFDEVLGVFTADKHLSRVAQWFVGLDLRSTIA